MSLRTKEEIEIELQEAQEKMSVAKTDLVKSVLTLILYGFILYFMVSEIAFAFRHPELTDTERFLRFWDVLRWK